MMTYEDRAAFIAQTMEHKEREMLWRVVVRALERGEDGCAAIAGLVAGATAATEERLVFGLRTSGWDQAADFIEEALLGVDGGALPTPPPDL